jgi:hypothetical protein
MWCAQPGSRRRTHVTRRAPNFAVGVYRTRVVHSRGSMARRAAEPPSRRAAEAGGRWIGEHLLARGRGLGQRATVRRGLAGGGNVRTTVPWYGPEMETLAALDRINELLRRGDEPTSNTSMRLPTALRDAATLAVDHLGIAPSTTALTVRVLRRAIESAVLAAALREDLLANLDAQPTLAETAMAVAWQEGSPIAGRDDLIESAVQQLTSRHPEADGYDVMLWAEAQAVAAGLM